jgi:hypothetical protein
MVPNILPTDASMVLVLGETGVGKSYFIKILAPENPNVVVGHKMRSCKLLLRCQVFGRF